jgi:hypothetical protein
VRRQETLSRVIYLENGTFTSPSVSVAESDAEIAIGATQFTIERTKDMDELRYTARTARSVRSRIIESGFLNELPVVLMDRSHTRYVVVAKDRYILLDENLEGTDAPSLLDAVSQLSTLGFLVLVAALFGSPLLVLTAAAAAAWRSRRGPAHRLWIWQSYVAVGCVVYLASSVVWLPRITDLLP